MAKRLTQEEVNEGLEEVKATTYGKEAIIDLVRAFLADKGRSLLLSRAKPENKDELLLDHAKYNAQVELQHYIASELGVDING